MADEKKTEQKAEERKAEHKSEAEARKQEAQRAKEESKKSAGPAARNPEDLRVEEVQKLRREVDDLRGEVLSLRHGFEQAVGRSHVATGAETAAESSSDTVDAKR